MSKSAIDAKQKKRKLDVFDLFCPVNSHQNIDCDACEAKYGVCDEAIKSIKDYELKIGRRLSIVEKMEVEACCMVDWFREMASINTFCDKQDYINYCPFCGSKHIDMCYAVPKERNVVYFIKCNACYASGGASENIDVAFEKWQKRFIPQNINSTQWEDNDEPNK